MLKIAKCKKGILAARYSGRIGYETLTDMFFNLYYNPVLVLVTGRSKREELTRTFIQPCYQRRIRVNRGWRHEHNNQVY